MLLLRRFGSLVCLCVCVCARARARARARERERERESIICICILHFQPLDIHLLRKMQTAGPPSRYVSANMAKEDIIKYLSEVRRKGVSLQGHKAQKLDEQQLRFLKQSGMFCASAYFAQSHGTNDSTQNKNCISADPGCI